jgi:hypothetical protein
MARWGGAPVIPAMQGSVNRRIAVQDGLGIKRDPVPKITNAKRAGDVTQVAGFTA